MKRTSKKSQLKAESTLQNRKEVSIMDSDWRSILEGLINDERSNTDFIGTDKIQALDKEMGFGYISDEKIEAKVVLQGSNYVLPSSYILVFYVSPYILLFTSS